MLWKFVRISVYTKIRYNTIYRMMCWFMEMYINIIICCTICEFHEIAIFSIGIFSNNNIVLLIYCVYALRAIILCCRKKVIFNSKSSILCYFTAALHVQVRFGVCTRRRFELIDLAVSSKRSRAYFKNNCFTMFHRDMDYRQTLWNKRIVDIGKLV